MSKKEVLEQKVQFLTKVTDWVMWWIGSIPSLIVHSVVFLTAFLLPVFNLVAVDKMLLVLTTVLSLEAIYLAIFIQMSVNRSQEHIEDIREDIEEIQDDIEEISEDIEEISEDIEEISVDIDDIQEDIEDIAEDEDDEDHNERAKNVMLKSNVSSNKSDIREMRAVIAKLQSELESLKKDDSDVKGNRE